MLSMDVGVSNVDAMGVRPVHRRKSFWLGILVMGFLSWAWWDSTQWESSLRYGRMSLRHAGSGTCLADDGRAMSVEPRWGRKPVDPEEVEWSKVRCDAPEVLRVREDPAPLKVDWLLDEMEKAPVTRNAATKHFTWMLAFPVKGAWAVYVPHWLVMVCFLIPWSGFLVWRWRRERRVC